MEIQMGSQLLLFQTEPNQPTTRMNAIHCGIQRALMASGMLLLTLGVAIQPSRASEITIPAGFTQSYFHDLTKQAGLAISFTQNAPAAALDFPHFDVGVESSFTQIDSGAPYWQLTYPGNPPHLLPVPRIRVRIGLPFGIDVGGVYGYDPSTDAKMAGGEVKWAAFQGGTVMPAIAIRGSYTALLGVSDINLETYAADVSISKGFAIFTPYIGLGEILIRSSENSPLVSLSSEQIFEPRGFVGVQIGIPFVRFAIEAAFSSIPTYTARLSVGL
jgi:hypothetical protein